MTKAPIPGKIFAAGWVEPGELPVGSIYCDRCHGWYMIGAEHMHDVPEQKPAMSMRERMARAICIREGVDPDAMGYGQGAIMTKDMPYRLWEARLHVVDAVLDTLLTDPGHNVTAAIVKPMDNRTPALDGFHALIRAIKDDK